MAPAFSLHATSTRSGMKGHSRWYDAYPNLLKLLDVLYMLPDPQREALAQRFMQELATGLHQEIPHLEATFHQLPESSRTHTRWYDSTPALRLLLFVAVYTAPRQLGVYVDHWLVCAYEVCTALAS
jgi:hypothetical protein